MLSNYHTLSYVAADLGPRISGRIISQVFSQERDQLVVTFEGLDEALIVSCRTEANILYLHPKFARARSNTASLLDECWGKKVLSVAVQPSDRVVLLLLASGHLLHCQFFGAASNVILVDEEGNITDAFKKAKTLVGTKYEPRSGELLYDVTDLHQRFRAEAPSPVGPALKRIFPSLGSTLVSEILYRSKVPASASVEELGSAETHRLATAVASVVSELATPAPLLYVRRDGEKDVPLVFSLIKLHHTTHLVEKCFDDIHEAIRFFLFRRQANRSLDDRKTKLVGDIKQKMQKAQRAADAVEDDLRKHDRSGQYEQIGKAVMSNLGVMRKGLKTISLDVDSQTVDVKLDPKLSPVENVQMFFDKAKKARLASRQGVVRVKALHASVRTAEDLLTHLEPVVSPDDLQRFATEHSSELEELGLGKKDKQREQLPFRIFTVHGGFEVWAGKSSANNDLLTMKHAKPNDFWFHARGSSGSHVVLKAGSGKGEISKKAKEQAAAIAAYYSKMKTSKLVPVAMTERKYVRKPKGSPPGTVVLEREKVIFVEPRLPPEERSSP